MSILSNESKTTIRQIAIILTELINENKIKDHTTASIAQKISSYSTSNSNSINTNIQHFSHIFNDKEILTFIPPSIINFISNLYLQLQMQLNTLKASLIYLQKANLAGIQISEDNCILLIFTAMIVSLKMWEDIIFEESSCSLFLNVHPKVLAELEASFLAALQFELYISEELFEKYNNIYLFLNLSLSSVSGWKILLNL